MEESKAAWEEVAGHMSRLGRRVREHYETRAATTAAATSEQVQDALRTVTDALDTAFTSLGEALRDPVFKEEATQAASALGDALGTTFTEVGEEIRKAFGPKGG